MTTFPLPTLIAQVTAAGITAPSYSDIYNSLLASYALIYGSDILTDASTQDTNWIAIQAAAINDANSLAIAVYNDFSPATAQGAGLSSVVKVNGIQRLVPSNSSAAIEIVGQAGTPITNGIVGDNAGLNTQWALPSVVNIPVSGTITVTAICTTAGAVTANVATLTVILTPTAGWQTASNAAAAAVGAPVETDAALRLRQTNSTALPSQTTLAGIFGTISNLAGVTDVGFDNNTTNATDGNGVPGHTLAMVVEGGDLQSIVNEIGASLSIGCGTFGNTSGTYVDPNYGFNYTIFFSIPTQQTILVQVTKTALTGYTTAIGTEIQNAVAAYISALGIGADVLLSRIYAPALLQGPFAAPASPNDALTYEITSLLIAISPGSPGSSDLTIAWNELAVCAPSNVTIL